MNLIDYIKTINKIGVRFCNNICPEEFEIMNKIDIRDYYFEA